MKNSFWKQVELNQKIVTNWPKWMRQIVINSKTIMSGQFIDRTIK